MRWFIEYIRSCFCKHEWELLSHHVAEKKYYWSIPNEVWLHSCKKCGYKKIYKMRVDGLF